MLLLVAQCDLFIAGNTDLLHFAVAMGVPTVALFSDEEDPAFRPTGREHVRVLDITEGERVDIETLMETVEAVTGGRATTASTVIVPDPEADAAESASPADNPPADDA
jgi:hypothetical protein